MPNIDSYEFWIDVVVTGNAIDTDNVSFGDTDGEGDCELNEYLENVYPGYKYSHSVDGKNVYSKGNDIIMVVITVGMISHEDLFK